jgi:apolipoprotein D and lipocalin family protein
MRVLIPALFLASALSPLSAPVLAATDDPPPVQTVPKVEASRYMGIWYEIANFPRFFQAKCVSDTTADYGVTDDGKVSVKNRCRTRDGSFDEITGIAEPVQGSHNAKLKVSFMRPFWGDYWVIALDPDYRWSVIGSPNRKSLWILARTPQLPADELKKALAAAEQQHYPMDKLRYTQQGAATSAR